MTGIQIFQSGKTSPAARACIPIEFEPTVPLLSWNNGWIAEYWYYIADVFDQAIYKPQYYLALELPSGKPIKMERLAESFCCLGTGSELAENEYYSRQQFYLNECTELLKKDIPSQEEVCELQKKWIDNLPEVLKNVLSDKSNFPYLNLSFFDQSACQPQNLLDMLKFEMDNAIKKGDANEIQRIQNEIRKLINTK